MKTGRREQLALERSPTLTDRQSQVCGLCTRTRWEHEEQGSIRDHKFQEVTPRWRLK